jgi:hypothetical protein
MLQPPSGERPAWCNRPAADGGNEILENRRVRDL